MKRTLILTTTEKIRGKIRAAKNISFCSIKPKHEATYQNLAKTINASLKSAYEKNKISKDELEEYKIKFQDNTQ